MTSWTALISAGIRRPGKTPHTGGDFKEGLYGTDEDVARFFALNVCPLYAHENRNGAVFFHHYDNVGVRVRLPLLLDGGRGGV